MTAAAFTFTPDADFVDRALDAELRRDSDSLTANSAPCSPP